MTPPGGDARVSVDEVVERLDAAGRAAWKDDELALARLIRALVRKVDALSAAAMPDGRLQADTLHARAHLLAAGLLGRLGFGDLARTLLLRFEPSQRHRVIAQQTWLLLDFGKPAHALTHTTSAPSAPLELVRVRALAHALSGDVHCPETARPLSQSRGSRARVAAWARVDWGWLRGPSRFPTHVER